MLEGQDSTDFESEVNDIIEKVESSLQESDVSMTEEDENDDLTVHIIAGEKKQLKSASNFFKVS